jgi:hypothetical protein
MERDARAERIQEENVRSISRIGSVAALTAAIALGASGTAFGTGADDIRLDLTSAVSPNQLDNNEFGKASLIAQPTWLDNDNSPLTPAEGAEEIRLDFDNDLKITVKKLPKCNEVPADLATMTTPEAIDACASSQVGAGAAKARFAAFGGPPFNYEGAEINLTVTAFNGPTSTAGPAECTDSSGGGPFNCEWVGGKPTLYLHARNAATNQTSLVRGEVQGTADTLPGAGTPAIAAGYGQRLAVTDGTDVAGDVGAVTLFNALVGKSYKYQKGGKTVKANYISARCNQSDDVDPEAAGTQPGFQAKAHTIYDDDATHSANATSSIDTDTTIQYCGTK